MFTWIQNIRIPPLLLVFLWFFAGVMVIRGGYLQTAFGKAGGYVRKVEW